MYIEIITQVRFFAKGWRTSDDKDMDIGAIPVFVAVNDTMMAISKRSYNYMIDLINGTDVVAL